MSISKVTLIGANGTLGPHILNALRSSDLFTVTVLARESSKSTYPDDVKVERMPDEPKVSDLVPLFKGQDAVVVASAGAAVDVQKMYIDAASQANVKRIIPANFGSCDLYDEVTRKYLSSFESKYETQKYLVENYSTGEGLTWTNFTCGHFLDMGVNTTFLNFDLDARKATLFDDGNVKWSTTHLPTVGKAVVQTLQKLEETKNRMLYIQSFCVSQNDVLKSLEKATGEKWKVEHEPSADAISSTEKKLKEKPDDTELEEEMVAVIGIVRGNWEGKKDFAVKLLELPSEDLDQVIKSIVDSK